MRLSSSRSKLLFNSSRNNNHSSNIVYSILFNHGRSVLSLSSSSSEFLSLSKRTFQNQIDNKSKYVKLSKYSPTYLIFGANTDVGKTVVSTTLTTASLKYTHNNTNNISPYYYFQKVNYIKPLQCGGSDESFVLKHTLQNMNNKTQNIHSRLFTKTLFLWDTPASPHYASCLEQKPISDDVILNSLQDTLATISQQQQQQQQQQYEGSGGKQDSSTCITFVETAGGVLSPSSSSPLNTHPRHAHTTLLPTNNSSSSSSSWGWSTQGDLYQPLHIPVILVGDGKLGGISVTISALESLLLRGYDVHAIVFLQSDNSSSGSGSGGGGGGDTTILNHPNVDALKEYTSRRLNLRTGSGLPLFFHSQKNVDDCIISLPSLPPPHEPLHQWLASTQVENTSKRFIDTLCSSYYNHITYKETLRDEGSTNIWWPFTQHKTFQDTSPTLIDGATGDYFNTLDSDLYRIPQFDACASWWTQGLGHGEAMTALASGSAAGRYGHVIFPNCVHEPAFTLSKRLVESVGKDWASRVFFTDDGSTAMEVAIKMGLRKFCVDRKLDKLLPQDSKNVVLTVCAQNDCYHGDTLGVMDVAEPSIFNQGQHPWYEPKGLFLAYPTVRYSEGKLGINLQNFSSNLQDIEFSSLKDVYDVNQRLDSDLYKLYFDSIMERWNTYENNPDSSRLIASVVIEPVLLGAGGMKFIDPLWQRALVDVARSKSVPVIFDEVASGFYRLGVSSCREILKVNPDIASYAKLLTAGTVPMSVTLASERVFNSFLGDSKAEALLHGHSYTAHPVGCVTALHALDTYESLLGQKTIEIKRNGISVKTELFNHKKVQSLSKLPIVQEAMALGTVVAVTLKSDHEGSGYNASSRSQHVVKYLKDHGVYARPLGNVVYIMVSLLTTSEECSKLCDVVYDALRYENNSV